MKFKKVFCIFVLLLACVSLLALLPLKISEVNATPNIVGTSTSRLATFSASQLKLGYGGGYYWLFYWNGSAYVYFYSSNLATWTMSGTLWNYAPVTTCGGLDVKIYGNTVYATQLYYSGTTFYVYFRKGTISDHTISWGGTVTVYSGVGWKVGGALAKTSDGTLLYVWIDNSPAFYYAKSVDDGANWVVNSFYLDYTDYGITLVPMANGKAMTLFRNPELRYMVWNGSSWGSVGYVGGVFIATPSTARGISATSHGDTVYVAYTKTTLDVAVRLYKNSAWQSEELVQAGAAPTTVPVLTVDWATDNVFCFWAGTVLGHVYYKQRLNSTGTWQTYATNWINELTTGGLAGNDLLTCSQSNMTHYVGLAYLHQRTSTFNVKFTYLDLNSLPDPPTSAPPVSGLADYVYDTLERINWTENDLTTKMAGYSLGRVTKAQLESYLNGLSAPMDILRASVQLEKYGIENAAKIKQALNDTVMMTNGLPETGEYDGHNHVFGVDARYALRGYYWAQKYNYLTSKWNLTKAYDNFKWAIDHAAVPATYFVTASNGTYCHWGESEPRYTVEASETMGVFLKFYDMGINGALSEALETWVYINNHMWNAGNYYQYRPSDTGLDCGAGSATQLVLLLKYDDRFAGNLSRVVVDVGTRFVDSHWQSGQWVAGGISYYAVIHLNPYNSERRLGDTLTAWASILGNYYNLTSTEKQYVQDMLAGYDTFSPAWKLLLWNSGLYDVDTGLFKYSSLGDTSNMATATASILLLYYGIVPQTGALAMPLSQWEYLDIHGAVDADLFSFNYEARTVKVSVQKAGTVKFQFGTSPATYNFAEPGVYNVTFAVGWNNIESVSKIGGLPSNRLYLQPNVAINSFEGPAATVYSGQYFYLNATVTHPDGVANFLYAKIEINGGIVLKWTAASNTFSVYADPYGYCTLNASASERTQLSETQYKLSWRIMLNAYFPDGYVSVLAANTMVVDVYELSGGGEKANLFMFWAIKTLNLHAVDWNGQVLNGATVYMDNGTEYSKQTTSGWANWTGIAASSVLVKVKWENSWVNGTMVTMDSHKTLDLKCKVYTFTPQALQWDLTTPLYPNSQARLTAPNGTQTSLISLDSSASVSLSQAQNGTWKIEVFWGGMKVNETSYSLSGNVGLDDLKLKCKVWSITFYLKDSNGNFLTASPSQVHYTYPNGSTLKMLDTNVGYGSFLTANGTSYYRVKFQDIWVSSNITLTDLSPSTTLITVVCQVYKLTIYTRDTVGFAVNCPLVLKRVEDSATITLNGMYGLPSNPTTGEFNMTHSRYVWPQLAIQTATYVVWVYYGSEQRGSATSSLTSNTAVTVTINTASTPGPGPGPPPQIKFSVNDTYVTCVKGQDVNFTLTVVWSQVSSITISSVTFEDYPLWFRIDEELPLTKWKESSLQPEGTVSVRCHVTVPWGQPEGLVSVRVSVMCPTSGGAVSAPGTIYLTVAGKELAPKGSIPEYMGYAFLITVIALATYSLLKKRR